MPHEKGCTRGYFRDWAWYDEQLVARGEDLFSLGKLIGWQQELATKNRGKRGRPFEYPDCLIIQLAHIKTVLHAPYRMMEGFCRIVLETIGLDAPDHTTIVRRVLDIDEIALENKTFEEARRLFQNATCASLDSTGLATSVFGS